MSPPDPPGRRRRHFLTLIDLIINEAGANLPNGNTNSLNNETETVEENTQEELA